MLSTLEFGDVKPPMTSGTGLCALGVGVELVVTTPLSFSAVDKRANPCAQTIALWLVMAAEIGG